MLQKINFMRKVCSSASFNTVVKFAKDLEFTIGDFKKDKRFHIKNIKGDLEITKITKRGDLNDTEVKYDKEHNIFFNDEGCAIFCFYITANIEVEEKDEQICDVTYQLQIPSARLQSLKVNEYFQTDIVLPGYDLNFTFYVYKIEPSSSSDTDIEIHIENTYNVEIQGRIKKSDVKFSASSLSDFNKSVLFRFDQNVYPASAIEELVSSSDESRPESVIKNGDVTSKLYKIGSSHLFADVFFITSDGTTIPSHRNILASSSNILLQIFKESTEIPVQIDADGFDADTIESALNFLYDKPDAINGKEIEVFEFAVKYGIQDLIDACCSFFEASVDPSNVCDFIQIAYFNNFEELKQKCLKVMVQKKDEIDPDEIADLPKNIVVDAFCFKL